VGAAEDVDGGPFENVDEPRTATTKRTTTKLTTRGRTFLNGEKKTVRKKMVGKP
jgi:hypothetical protein